MAPKSPWKITKDKNERKPDPKSPGTEVPVGDSFDYSQAQDDEIEVLKAIYMDDYEEVEVKSAWSVSLSERYRSLIPASFFRHVHFHQRVSYMKCI